jgi:hypothetical protein
MKAGKVLNVIELKPSRQALVFPAARNHVLRPRYAMVRNPNREVHRSHVNLGWALYDIVDNGQGSESVLAYGVRYEPACFLVQVLNLYEDAERARVGLDMNTNDDNGQEVPPPAA